MILDQLAESTRQRVEKRKKIKSLEQIIEEALACNINKDYPFEQALAEDGMSFICEVKKASPSKGVIASEFPYLEIAEDYQRAGASAISVLTEPEYFQGSDQYLQDIAKVVSIPVLRKDFTVDVYQIYEAKVLGASAVLLICSLLNDQELMEFLDTAHSLGLSALVEAHDGEEVKRGVRAGARIIGVNNRDLKTFAVDIRNSINLRHLIPENMIYVSESGIATPEDVGELYRNKTAAVLVGETLMRSPDKRKMLEHLRRDCHD